MSRGWISSLRLVSHPGVGLASAVAVGTATALQGDVWLAVAMGLLAVGLHLAAFGARWEWPLAVAAGAVLALGAAVTILPARGPALAYGAAVAVAVWLGSWLAGRLMPGGRWAVVGLVTLAVGHWLRLPWWQLAIGAAAAAAGAAALGPTTGIVVGAGLGGALVTTGTGLLLPAAGPGIPLLAGTVAAGLGLGSQLLGRLGPDRERRLLKVVLTTGTTLVLAAVAASLWTEGMPTAPAEAARAAAAALGAAARLFLAYRPGITARARLGVTLVAGVSAGWMVLGASRWTALAGGGLIADAASIVMTAAGMANRGSKID